MITATARINNLHIVGSVGFGLADLLRAEGEAATRASGKNLINIIRHGGTTNMDTFDPESEV
mgnify:CR=1 FL=1